jgi:hypothetical protein
VADRVALLEAERLPGVPGGNPLRDSVEWVPVEDGDSREFPAAVSTRRLCCLTYLLRERLGVLCQNCPYLPVSTRAAMVRERHHVATGGPPGPATLRSKEIGLQRASLRRLLDAGPT